MDKYDIRDLVFAVLIAAIVILVVTAKDCEPMVPSNRTLVVEFLDTKTKVYRVKDGGTVCYVAVGRLHGYTVSIDCVKDYTERVHGDEHDNMRP